MGMVFYATVSINGKNRSGSGNGVHIWARVIIQPLTQLVNRGDLYTKYL